MSHPNVIL